MAERGRLFAYPMTLTRGDIGLRGELVDWPECEPVGRTREAIARHAVRSISSVAIARMKGSQPVPLRGSPESGAADEALVELPLRMRIRFTVYEAMRWVRRLVGR
jgi:hypothetical protein